MKKQSSREFILNIYSDAVCIKSHDRATAEFYYILAPSFSENSINYVSENVLGAGKTEYIAWKRSRDKILKTMITGFEGM